jgi:uncharacterized protein (DUF362 family)/Pyruvate/2-oxoacid:ferredoxin oxidoreductase delta subunit
MAPFSPLGFPWIRIADMASLGRSKVAIVECPSYSPEDLARAVRKSLAFITEPDAELAPGKKVFVKINHLSPHAPPERAICTHPLFVREVLKALLERKVRPTVGDDVNFRSGTEFMISGFRRVCAEFGVPLVNLREAGFVRVPLKGKVLQETYIARPVLEADLVLNLPKLKTHSLTALTGAVKNMYGAIPYGLRLEGHRRFFHNDEFARMLVDVFSAVPRQLVVMDAVVAMEGEGPSAGSPKRIGLIISGTDGVAVDAVASRIIGYDPLDVFTTAEAQARGIGIADPGRIDIVGAKVEDALCRGFRRSLAATRLFRRWLPSFLYGFVSGRLILTPEVIPSRCTACLDCLNACPTAAISLAQDKAWVDEGRCIHCQCCHEVCPQRSIRLKQRRLGRLVRGFSRLCEGIQSFF